MIGVLGKDLIGYKKIKTSKGQMIVVLLIPKGSKYHISRPQNISLNTQGAGSSFLRKMRADKAFVLGLFGRKGMHKEGRHSGYYDAKSLLYKTGEMVMPDEFDGKDFQCANGIHFFLNVNDAIEWS